MSNKSLSEWIFGIFKEEPKKEIVRPERKKVKKINHKDNELINKAYFLLYEKYNNKDTEVTYSGRFSRYNAHIINHPLKITVKMSRQWESVDDDIKIGLIQVLLSKIFKSKKKTMHMDIYNHFIKSLDKYETGVADDFELEESFNRINEQYFDNELDMPHIKFGRESTTRLGSYNFHTNTVIISSIFKGFPELLDAVMYHELLHKFLKYRESGTKSHFHTREFRIMEKRLDREKEIQEFLRRKSWKRR